MIQACAPFAESRAIAIASRPIGSSYHRRPEVRSGAALTRSKSDLPHPCPSAPFALFPPFSVASMASMSASSPRAGASFMSVPSRKRTAIASPVARARRQRRLLWRRPELCEEDHRSSARRVSSPTALASSAVHADIARTSLASKLSGKPIACPLARELTSDETAFGQVLEKTSSRPPARSGQQRVRPARHAGRHGPDTPGEHVKRRNALPSHAFRLDLPLAVL